jgi:hypothetical protein
MTVTAGYIAGRKAWSRPQAMLWSELSPTISNDGKLIPVGYEIGSDISGISNPEANGSFIIISDHNRSPIDISNERIEQRQRMANGTMRSYHIADKLSISLSWSMLPSRGFAIDPNFEQEFGKPTSILTPEDKGRPRPNTYFAHKSQQYTADGGAGGSEMLEWYEEHKGPFWVLLSYDKYQNFGDGDQARQHLNEYSQAIQMYIASFNYSVIKRGGNNFDMWDVSLTLEEA